MTAMNELGFAAWVAPIAAAHRAARDETVRLARSLPDPDLARETGDRGWTVRDEFVHIGTSETNVVKVLRAVVDGGAADTSFFQDLDANNARALDAARGRPMPAVADDLERLQRDLQTTLAGLTADDEARRYTGLPFPIGQVVAGYQRHEPYHLRQIREAIAAGGARA